MRNRIQSTLLQSRAVVHTPRRARRLNFQNTSGHARTLVRTLWSHGKLSVRPNHTTMEVDNAIFVLQKNTTSWPQTEVLPLIKELNWLTIAVKKTNINWNILNLFPKNMFYICSTSTTGTELIPHTPTLICFYHLVVWIVFSPWPRARIFAHLT